MSIESIRSRFNKEVNENPSLYHPIDIKRVSEENWQVKRFLDEFGNDEDKAFDLLIKAMRWKKEFGIHDRNDQFYPREFYEMTKNEIIGQDKKGRLIQMEVFKYQHNFKELNLLYRQFVAHSLERVDRMAGENGFILLMDINGAGISNIDLDLTKFKLSINELYPSGLRQMFVIDLPWLLNPIMKIIVGFMSPKIRDKLICIKRQQLTDYIDPENIPISLNGKRNKSDFPSDLEPLEKCWKRLELSEKFIDKYYSFYNMKSTRT